MRYNLLRLLLCTVLLFTLVSPVLAENTLIPQEGLQLWLRTDAGVEREGSAVVRWLDQSGKGNDAVAAAQTAPTWTDAAYGSHGALRFDEEAFMQVTHTAELNAGEDGFSVFMVYRHVRGIRLAQKKSGASGTQADAWFVAAAQGLGVAGTYRQGTPLFEASEGVNIQGNVFDPEAEAIMIFSGDQLLDTLSGVKPQVPNEDDLFLGKRDHPAGTALGWEGDLFEVIIYNRALSVDERAAVAAYLLAKYQG